MKTIIMTMFLFLALASGAKAAAITCIATDGRQEFSAVFPDSRAFAMSLALKACGEKTQIDSRACVIENCTQAANSKREVRSNTKRRGVSQNCVRPFYDGAAKRCGLRPFYYGSRGAGGIGQFYY